VTTSRTSEQAAQRASVALCRVMAHLDGARIPELHATMAPWVAQAMQAIYGARAPGSSAARRAAAAATAGQFLGKCLTVLQAQPTPPPPIQGVLGLTARAASAVYALQQQAEAEFASVSGARATGSPTSSGVPQQATLGWSRGVAIVHALGQTPILPPTLDAEDSLDAGAESEPGEGDGPPDDDDELLDDGPVMTLDALRALAEAILADDALEREAAEDVQEPPVPPLAPATPPPRQDVDHMGDRLRIELLDELASDFDTRQAGMSEDASWRELERLEQSMFAHVDGLAWQGTSIVEPLARAVVTAKESGPAFAAALPLLCMDGVDAADAVLRAVERGLLSNVDGLVEALRMVHNPEAAARLPLLLEEAATPGARQIASRVLLERDALGDHQLERLLVDPDPTLLGVAVRHILSAGKGYALARLEYMAERPADEPAATEVVVAAAVLGSAKARERLRERVRAGDANDRLLHALAACGDERDVAPIAQLALVGGPLASPAMVALGWLGSASAVAPLRELADDDGFAEEAMAALAQLLGPAATDPAAKLGPGRWWAGVPWSVQDPARLLVAEDTGALWRELAFLELVARTGQHIPFDPTWSVTRQRAAAASWKAIADRLGHTLPTHTWLYRGQLDTAKRSR
jgi:hypothetical protein